MGPQRSFWVPHAGAYATGVYGASVFSLSDPVGRLATVVSATAGSADSWRGASLQTAWRGWPAMLGIQLQATGKQFHTRSSGAADRRYYGAQLSLEKHHDLADRAISASLGGWVGKVKLNGDPAVGRTSGFAALEVQRLQQSGVIGLRQYVDGLVEVGATDGEGWSRASLAVGASIHSPGPDLAVSVQGAIANADNAPFELYQLGGDVSPHLDSRSSSNLVAAPVLRNVVQAGSNYVKVRGELLQLLPVTLYGEWFWPGGSGEGYFATVGVVQQTSAERVPLLATPSVVGEFGAGIVVAGPHAKRASAYLMLRIRP
jgi:hypothetical protein